MQIVCFGCGGRFDAVEGPTHDYMLSTPGCWRAYGEVLAREYADPDLFVAAHRFSVDAYALQHPGELSDRRARQSVWVHYLALHLVFEHKAQFGAIPRAMAKLAALEFPEPQPVRLDFTIIHSDLLAAPEEEHEEMARRWAQSAYDAWAQLKECAGAFIRESLA